MPGDRAPFRKAEFSDEAAASAYRNAHDLREMYTRENTERRRIGAHTLRRHLTAAQDKALTARMTKLRDAFEVANNDDIVLAYCQELVAAGKGAELSPVLVEAAAKSTLRRRS
ncbi:MAG: hypothetical protein AABX89_06105 [Candidatus Thermoplasmatota archaeon]